MLALLPSALFAVVLLTVPARADEPGSGRVSGAGTSKVSPRWPLASLASAASADRLDEVKARGNLILGTCYTAPPYCFREPGQSNIKGYDLDIMARVAAHLGVRHPARPGGERRTNPFARAGQDRSGRSIDDVDPETGEPDRIQHPVFLRAARYHRQKASGITSARQFAGRKIAAVKGSAVDAAVEAAIPQVKIFHFGDLARASTRSGTARSKHSPRTRRRPVPFHRRFREPAGRRHRDEEGRDEIARCGEPGSARSRGFGRGPHTSTIRGSGRNRRTRCRAPSVSSASSQPIRCLVLTTGMRRREFSRCDRMLRDRRMAAWMLRFGNSTPAPRPMVLGGGRNRIDILRREELCR